MNIWITADTHFGHAGILRHTDRPWNDVEEMNSALAENWNAAVRPGDDVWVLGDFSFLNATETASLFHRLNGKKHIVWGNHDKSARRLQWSSSHDLHTLRHDRQSYVMCHYPLMTWANAHHGTFMLHGHSHGRLSGPETTRMDVGVDTHPEYRPYHLDEIREILSTRTYLPVDHHES